MQIYENVCAHPNPEKNVLALRYANLVLETPYKQQNC